MGSNGLWKQEMLTIAKVSSIGSTRTSAMAPDEMKPFSSARPRARREKTIERGYSKSLNWLRPFVGRRNLRLNHRSRPRPGLRLCDEYGQIRYWIGCRKRLA